MSRTLIATAEIPANLPTSNLEVPKINSVTDGLYLFGGLLLPVIAYGIKELLQFNIKKQNAQLELEIKKRELDQQEKAERVEYLEELVKTLMAEIFTLTKAIDRSGPLNVKMYEPPAKEKV